jgi:peptidoglycan hydrolase-like protein with peptidoglycan-binding domain
VGDGQYAGRATLPACSQTARAVSARLRRLGFTVEESLDGPAVSLRDALSEFADRVAASREPALVYVCAEATAVDRRLFVLPADVDLQQRLRPETQGIVLRALLNAMAGTKGIMIAELSMQPGADPSPATAALREGLPEGLHLVLAAGEGKQAGTLGTRLANDETALDQGWDQLASSLLGPSGDAPSAVSSPAPLPSPAAPVAVASLPTAVAPVAAERPLASENTEKPNTVKRTADDKTGRPRPSGDERIRRQQAALTRHGFYNGPLDGVADNRTVQAIRSFQISLGDRATGSLTQTEIIRLLNNW